ncbi:hypothetical protein GP486_004457 [Trichoglossum hirsutum]|uniref:t-SNARE coiled-coil homology domain-containing protein n=1 Tax=Trichoglossum hirsutum TaxID=265104 RepID=A0A9P8LB53_9PEZI|nr:hypothetical protein GP486_004457 [Trichoglossum hirsutum]
MSSNPLDSDPGSELFAGYEADLKLVQANLNQQFEQIPDLAGEPRKAAIGKAERALDEACEIMRIEKQNIPSRTRNAVNVRFRNFESDIDAAKRRLKTLTDDRAALFGAAAADPYADDAVVSQRQQLLSGTERLQRSSGRLIETQRIAHETESIGASTLANLQGQRETILHTRDTLSHSETQVDRSVKTLRGMARR